MLTVVQQEVVGLRPFRQGLGWLRDLHYRGSSDVVHLHYSLSVQYPNCFPLPASRRDRHGAVGREPSNSTGGTFTRVARHCAGCCAGTMQLVWEERATRPFSAATCRRAERTTVVYHSLRTWCARLSGGMGCGARAVRARSAWPRRRSVQPSAMRARSTHCDRGPVAVRGPDRTGRWPVPPGIWLHNSG